MSISVRAADENLLKNQHEISNTVQVVKLSLTSKNVLNEIFIQLIDSDFLFIQMELNK